MNIAKIRVYGTRAEAEVYEPITTSISGAVVKIAFESPVWDGLSKNVVFRGAVERTVLDVTDEVYIPPETVSIPGIALEIGVLGIGSDRVIPTVWADLGTVQDSAPVEPGDISGNQPGDTPGWVQLIAAVGSLANLATEDRSSLVAAINEVNGNVGPISMLEHNEGNLVTAVNAQARSLLTLRKNFTANLNATAEAIQDVKNRIGDLSDLKTDSKNSLVDALNELADKIENGNGLSDLVRELAKTVSEVETELERLKEEGVASDDDLKSILQRLDNLEYVAIEILSFTCRQGITHEKGTFLSFLTFDWTLNKEQVSSQEFNGEQVGNDLRSYTYEPEEPITFNKVFTLKVMDERLKTNTATIKLNFVSSVRYGCLSSTDRLNSETLLKLNKKVQSGRGITFTVTPGDGERPTYACPESYGTPKFTIGGFEYAWNRAATIDFTNEHGYTERYTVWMHPQQVSGSMTITVS